MSIQAQIFLADQRGCSQTDLFRSYHTFNFGAYADESRQPFGALHLLNDDTLRAGASLILTVERNTQVMLLPVVGGLEYQSAGANGFLEAGELGVLSLSAGMTYTVSNPYETETINFIQVGFTEPSAINEAGFTRSGFDLAQKNTLLPLFDPGNPESGHRGSGNRGFIGRYDGRQEGQYTVTADPQGRGIFVFVLQGVFETANRLLHEKDGLALWCTANETVEFEALANESLLLLLDVG